MIPGTTPSTPATEQPGRELGRRRGRVEAAVARSLVRDEGRQLALEPEHGGVRDRDPGRDRGIVEDVARLERVGAIEDDVVAGDDPVDVVRDEHLLVRDDRHVRVERGERLAGALDLLLADAVVGVDDLALEVREVDDVEVDDPDRPHACGREIQGGRRAEPARADQQHLRAEQLRLALRADLGDQQVAAVALLLGLGELRVAWSSRARSTSRPGSRPTSMRHPCSPCPRASPRRTGSGRHPRSTGRRACHGRGPRPRSAARDSSSRRAWRRGCSPGPTPTPRGRRSPRCSRAGGARRSRWPTPRGCGLEPP